MVISQPIRRWLTIILIMALHLLYVQTAQPAEVAANGVADLRAKAEELKTAGYYSKAIPYMEKVLASIRGADAVDKAAEARCLDALVELQYLAGNYRDAEPNLMESLTIREELFGSDHIDTAGSYHHLGVLNNLLARYIEAEEYLEKALKLNERLLGKNHPIFAQTLTDLARCHIGKDERQTAEALLSEALAIQEGLHGPHHPDLVQTLNTFAWLHIDTDEPEKSEPYSSRALAIGEKLFGPEHPYIADSLNYIGRLHYSRQNHEESIAANKRALTIREKFLGPNHPDVGLSLNNLALPYCGLEQYETARSLFVRAVSIREKAFGTEHTKLLVMLQNTGWVHQVLGDYKKAAAYYERALNISERTYGPDSITVADRRKEIAGLYFALGEYEKAETMLLKTLSIYEATFGSNHLRVANNLSNLAFIYHAKGDYLKCEQLYKRTIGIYEKHFKKTPTNLATAMSNLAAVYEDTGRYDQAGPLYERALAIVEDTLGPHHTTVAILLNNMGQLNSNLADYGNAETQYKRALNIWESVLGPEHPNVATTLDNLAILYEYNGDYEKAEPLFKRSLQIREDAYGPNHSDVAKTLNNLATVYSFLGDYEKSIPLYQRTLEIKAKTVGKKCDSYANSLHNLAATHLKLKQYDEAESLYLQAMETWTTTFGAVHPTVSTGYGHLSRLYGQMNDHEKASDYIIQSLEIDKEIVDQVLGFTSQSQKMRFFTSNRWSLHHYLNLVSRHYRQDLPHVEKALDAWLQWKGLVLETQRKHQSDGLYADDPEALKLYEELTVVRGRLSKLLYSKAGNGEGEAYIQQRAELVNEKERLEARLSRVSQGFSQQQVVANADSENVQRKIPTRSVFIEFARVDDTTLIGAGELEEGDHGRYMAFVLHPENGDKASIIDLGDAATIDQLVSRCKQELTASGKKTSTLNSTKELYQRAFQPLVAGIGDAKSIFISPDGGLNLIPFEILQQPNGRFLIEEYTFNYLAAGRDLLGFVGNDSRGNKCLLMGAPDFRFDPAEKSALINADKPDILAKRSADLGELSFAPLHHAKAELEAIGEILGPERSAVYTGKHALEETLFNTASPEILHLATHGFFLSDQELPGEGRGWNTASLPIALIQPANPIQGKIDIENPLLRSGILLAGAQRSLTEGSTDYYDGIVTAEKILGMNLHGTKMVVLSACDTGLGEVKSGEGVFGLRRAFSQAGAKSLVMSMWKVPDRETKELMVQFYRNIESGKMNRCQALRQAALKEMEIVRQRYGHANPRYWGAFVFMGEP